MKFTGQKLSHCNSVHIKSHTNHSDIEPTVDVQRPKKSLQSHGKVMVKFLLFLELEHKVGELQG